MSAPLWVPQPGPQTAALQVPYAVEANLGGARGGGKTDAVIGAWIQHEACFAGAAKGVVVRTEFKQLRDFRERARLIFRRLPKRRRPKWVGGEEAGFRYPNGARLLLIHARTVDDAEKYQGWSVNFLAIEEMTHWKDPEPINRLFAILRDPHVPTRFIASCNPGGPGHAWVKEDWIDPAPAYRSFEARGSDGQVLRRTLPDGRQGPPKRRVHIRALVKDNPLLLRRDPDYVLNLRRQAPHIARAWEHGDWDIAPGAYLEGLWDPERHVIDDFEPPHWWPRFMALDWGYRAPFSLGWYTLMPAEPRPKVIRYRELYGWGGRANVGARWPVPKVARALKRINAEHERPDANWALNVADRSMWNEDGRAKGGSVALEFSQAGVEFERGPGGHGSRVATLGLLVSRLHDDTFLVCRRCKHWLRTVPLLPPDETHPEDIDTEAEDHAMDETRYALWSWEAYADSAPDRRRFRPGPVDVTPRTRHEPVPGPWVDGRAPVRQPTLEQLMGLADDA